MTYGGAEICEGLRYDRIVLVEAYCQSSFFIPDNFDSPVQ